MPIGRYSANKESDGAANSISRALVNGQRQEEIDGAETVLLRAFFSIRYTHVRVFANDEFDGAGNVCLYALASDQRQRHGEFDGATCFSY